MLCTNVLAFFVFYAKSLSSRHFHKLLASKIEKLKEFTLLSVFMKGNEEPVCASISGISSGLIRFEKAAKIRNAFVDLGP